MKKMTCLIIGLFTLSLAFADSAAKDNSEERPNQPVQLMLKDKKDKNAGQTSAILLNAIAKVHVNGVVTDVTLTHEFENPSDEWVEGNYLFPLPANSAVDKLTLKIGDNIIVGKIRKKETAKKIYTAAVNNGQKAALLEQQRGNLFTAKAGNIPPHSKISVTLHYVQPTHYDSGEFSLRLPTTFTPRYVVKNTLDSELPQQHFAPKTNNRLQLQIALDAGAKITALHSPSHATRNTLHDDGKTATISTQSAKIAMDRDFRLTWRLQNSDEPLTLAFTEQTTDGFFTSLRFIPALTAKASTLSRDVVLIIDTSGSMGGSSIRQARAGALAALAHLGDQDRFNLIEFNSQFTALFPHSQTANSDNLERARQFIRGLKARGGTKMYAPLDKALSESSDSEYLRQIVFLTDGAVSNESQLYNLIDEKLGQARLFTVAIGSAPNDFFMRQIAQAGRGDFTAIAKVSEVKKAIKKLFAKIQHPTLTDIHVSTAGETPEFYPNPIGDVYWGSPIVAHLHTQTPPTSLRVEGKLLGKDWQKTLSAPQVISSDAKAVADSALAKLWAREKVATLLTRKNYAEDALAWEDYAKAVEDIGLRYQMATEFTAFVAVEEKLSRPAQEKLVKKSVSNQIPNGTMGFPATATSSTLTAILGTILLVIAVLLSLLARRKPQGGTPC